MVFGSSYLIKKLVLTLSEINILFFCFGISILLAQIALQWLYRVMHKLKVLRLFSIFFLFGLLIIGNVENVTLIYFALTLIAFSIGVMYPSILNIIDDTADSNDRGEKLGINTSVQSLAQALSLLSVGLFVYFVDIQNVLYLVMMFTLATFFSARSCKRRSNV
jgi:predicted MFS family arabinose efflux permease